MRVVQGAGWRFPDGASGTEVYLAELSRRLRAAGHEALIAAPDPLGGGVRTYDEAGTPVFRYAIDCDPRRDEAHRDLPVRGAARFHEWLADVRPDVVHLHTLVSGMGLAEARAARAIASRLIVTAHAGSLGFTCLRGTMMRWGASLCGPIPGTATCTACALLERGVPRPLGYAVAAVPTPISRVARQIPAPAGPLLGMRARAADARFAQRELLELVDHFVVLTDWAREVLVRNGAPPEKVIVNRLGTRFRSAAPAPRTSGALSVAYVGRFDAPTGVEVLARAIASLPDTLPIRFELHGPVRNRADLAAVTRVKALARGGAWVTFGQELDAAGVQALLGRVDAVCCPSRVVQGGSMIAIEAAAAGVPVIGSNIPALSTIVADGVNGQLVPPGDWRVLASVFRRLAADRGIVGRWRTTLGGARTMDDVTSDYLSLYGA